MIRHIHMVTPELPPRAGGVADYAARLAEHWPEGKLSEWWVAAGAVAAVQAHPAWTVKTVPVDASGKRWPETGTLFVHYTQYGYAGGGIPWRLVVGLRRWRRNDKSFPGREARRLVVFFHETWQEGPPWRRRGLVAPFARWCARALAGAADAVAVNCGRHAAQLGNGCDVLVLPVPANISPGGAGGQGLGAKSSKLRLVIFGLPETRLRTLKAHRGFVSWLRNRGGLEELVLLGAGEETDRFAVEGLRLADDLAGAGVRRVGATDAAGVSVELFRADLGLSAYAADEAGKSGTLAALFAHACAVGCAGHDAGGLALDLSPGANGAPRDWNQWQDAATCAKREARVAAYVADALNWDKHAARLAKLIRES